MSEQANEQTVEQETELASNKKNGQDTENEATDGNDGNTDIPITQRTKTLEGVVEGEIVESGIIEGSVNWVLNSDDDVGVYFFEFDDSERVFPVCSNEVLDSNDRPFFSSSKDISQLEHINPTETDIVETETENETHYAVGHIVEQGESTYCVVTNVSDRREVAKSKLTDDVQAIEKEGSDGFVFSIVECDIVPGGIDSTMYESEIDYDKMSYIENVSNQHKVCVHRPMRNSVYTHEEMLPERLPDFITKDRSFMSSISFITELHLALTTGAICFTVANYIASVQYSTTFLVPLPLLLFLTSGMVITALALLSYGFLLGTYDRYSFIDPHVAQNNIVDSISTSGASTGKAAEKDGLGSQYETDSVTLEIDSTVDAVTASGMTSGEEVLWEWKRDSTGNLPKVVQDLLNDTPMYDEEIIVTVKKDTKETSVETRGDDSVLCSENGEWIICKNM